MNVETSEETFCMSWLTWEDAILGYSNASGHKSVGLKHALRDWSHQSLHTEDEHGLGILIIVNAHQMLHI